VCVSACAVVAKIGMYEILVLHNVHKTAESMACYHIILAYCRHLLVAGYSDLTSQNAGGEFEIMFACRLYGATFVIHVWSLARCGSGGEIYGY